MWCQKWNGFCIQVVSEIFLRLNFLNFLKFWNFSPRIIPQRRHFSSPFSGLKLVWQRRETRLIHHVYHLSNQPRNTTNHLSLTSLSPFSIPSKSTFRPLFGLISRPTSISAALSPQLHLFSIKLRFLSFFFHLSGWMERIGLNFLTENSIPFRTYMTTRRRHSACHHRLTRL